MLTINRLLALHAAFKRWRKRRKTVRALADLDERQLRDIGLTRDDGITKRLPSSKTPDRILRQTQFNNNGVSVCGREDYENVHV